MMDTTHHPISTQISRAGSWFQWPNNLDVSSMNGKSKRYEIEDLMYVSSNKNEFNKQVVEKHFIAFSQVE